MYTKFTEKSELIHNKQYLCVVKGFNNHTYYTVLTWYSKIGTVDKYEFTGKGFYDFDSEYGYFKLNDIIAYQEIEEYVDCYQKDKCIKKKIHENENDKLEKWMNGLGLINE